jgi:hypothetical protein
MVGLEKRRPALEGPMVRIRFPPAASHFHFPIDPAAAAGDPTLTLSSANQSQSILDNLVASGAARGMSALATRAGSTR